MADDIAEETVKKDDHAADLGEERLFADLEMQKPPSFSRAQETLRLMQAADAPPDPAAAKVNKAYSQYRTDYLQGVEAGRAEGQQQAVRYAFAWIETVYGIGHAERYLAAWNAA